MRSMTDILSQQVTSGTKIKPNRLNPVTKNREEMKRRIAQRAAQSQRDFEDVAYDMVKQNVPDIQRFVISKGEQPNPDLIGLCIQAAELNQREVKKIADIAGVSMEDAQILADENETDAFNSESSEADYFIGSIIGAVASVAQKGIQKIADKRNEKGKPNKFWNWLAGVTTPSVDTGYSYGMDAANLGEGLKIAARDVLDDIKERERKAEMKKILPVAIFTIIAIILITVLITANASKNK